MSALVKASDEAARAAGAGDQSGVDRWLKRREAVLGTASADSWTREELRAAAEAGRRAKLALEARRYWLGERLAEARAAKRARNRLRPYRDTRGAALDVTS